MENDIQATQQAPQYHPQPPQPALIIVDVGRLSVGIVKLNGAQSRKASFMARLGDEIDTARCRALFAIRKINDEPIPEAKSDGDLNRVASRFEADELDAFLVLYREVTATPGLDDLVKKSLERQGLLSP